MNHVQKKNHILFYLLISILISFLIVFLLILFNIHIPYVSNNNQLIDERNKILNTNKLTYDNYFNAYHRQTTTYVIKVKKDNQTVLQAYDKNYQLVNEYNQSIYSFDALFQKLKVKFHINKDDIEIGYEDNNFLYVMTYQSNAHLYYRYYQVSDGKFLKEYRL